MYFPFGFTVTLIKRAITVDQYGDETVIETTEVIPNVGFAPGGSQEEDSAGQHQVVADYSLFIPYRTDLDANDRFQLGTEIYEIAGEPRAWHHPMTGWEPGTQVPLKRWEG